MQTDFSGPASHVFMSQRTRLHFLDWGNATAPPLILLHGGRDHARSWDWVAQELRHDWHVIAPDLRGHGDSGWSPEGAYSSISFVYDLAQLIDQLAIEPVSIVAHSLGGAIALRYAGLYPDKVRRLVAIEGLGPSPVLAEELGRTGTDQKLRDWIDERRRMSGRSHRRYATIDEACARMKAENPSMDDDRVRHLTIYGVNRNEDGSYSWKFDNYIRAGLPIDITPEQLRTIWGRISCPTLLAYGADSWASNPESDGRLAYFANARVALFQKAGHWLHHDRFDAFVSEIRAFL